MAHYTEEQRAARQTTYTHGATVRASAGASGRPAAASVLPSLSCLLDASPLRVSHFCLFVLPPAIEHFQPRIRLVHLGVAGL